MRLCVKLETVAAKNGCRKLSLQQHFLHDKFASFCFGSLYIVNTGKQLNSTPLITASSLPLTLYRAILTKSQAVTAPSGVT